MGKEIYHPLLLKDAGDILEGFLSLSYYNLLGQNSYLLSFRHTTNHGNEYFYFYLESAIDASKDFTIDIDGKTYSIKNVRMFEYDVSNYLVCCEGNSYVNEFLEKKHAEKLDSLLRKYHSLEKEIVTKYGFGVKEKKLPNVKKKLNKFDLVRIYKVEMEFCECEKSLNDVSSLTNILYMPKSVPKIYEMSKEEVSLLKRNMCKIIESDFVQGALPDPIKYLADK